jgi:hypothetical protein
MTIAQKFAPQPAAHQDHDRHASIRVTVAAETGLRPILHEGRTMMDARKVAAQFAAYTWYEESRAGNHSHDEAMRFAHDHWSAFQPIAHQGLGQLLIRLATPRPKQKRVRRTIRSLAAAG